MNKDYRYTIRFTSKEWEGIHKRAANKDMKVSDYIRLMIDIGERTDYKNTDSASLNW